MKSIVSKFNIIYLLAIFLQPKQSKIAKDFTQNNMYMQRTVL